MSDGGFDYKEYVKYVQSLGIAKSEFRIWLKTFLLKEAQRAVSIGKPLTPVDTGYLRNSWYIGDQKIVQTEIGAKGTSKSGNTKMRIDKSNSDVLSIKVIGNVLEVEIGLSAEYASFIEYGHRSYQGKYMLKIAIERVTNALPARFNKDFKNWLKEKGVV